MNVCAVIVTYGNRYNLLKESVESCFLAGIKRLIIIANKPSSEYIESLRELEKTYRKKLKILYFSENLGSAGGYKKGFQEAEKEIDCEYILALDDDNIIPLDFLKKVEAVFEYLGEKDIMLGMYRPIWNWDKKAIQEGWIKTYNKNNFMGINFWDFVLGKIKKIFSKLRKKSFESFYPIVPAKVSAMGGLIFHKSILRKIGYPREEFFIYADDHEFTYRFSKRGGKIYLCGNIPIKDIDFTHYNNGERIHYFHKNFSDIKLYYLIRNHTYFSKEFITNKIFFYGNMVFYLILLTRYILKTSPKLFFRRYKLILKAISDGLNDRLGKTF